MSKLIDWLNKLCSENTTVSSSRVVMLFILISLTVADIGWGVWAIWKHQALDQVLTLAEWLIGAASGVKALGKMSETKGNSNDSIQ